MTGPTVVVAITNMSHFLVQCMDTMKSQNVFMYIGEMSKYLVFVGDISILDTESQQEDEEMPRSLKSSLLTTEW